ncbi:lytic murein transglycosylase [Aureimonas mangrovi]|uniref:lytic murein transglycosylase n=1 Tax=Aureimonas mangrovi TaxID=2758041 RepID=UPI00163D8E76|nr:lytic murein transglycosylase [Aureimonas mangrovi]
MKAALAAALLLAGTAGAHAQSCGGDFGQFVEGVRQEAIAQGMSQDAVRRATSGLRIDQRVLQRDRAQGVFQQAWLTFAGRMISQNRLDRGRQELQRNAALFRRIEAETGVPGAVLTAFWGLETDFGGFLGDFETLPALATLAHDCRRPELFRPHLLAAIQLVDMGYLEPEQMRGAWAGELGQTQLLPEDYIRFGTDADGNGRIDLIRDSADALFTTAKFIQNLGWRRGEPWIEEVRVPDDFPFDRAGVYAREPRSAFAALGVTKADGSPLETDGLQASIVLPQGRGGPAFLTFANFDIYIEWNNSLVYTLSAAYFATRLDGAPRVREGNPRPGLDADQMVRLQQRLQARGHDVGKIDGILGAGTRAAVRAEQIRLGMPADAWPTSELLTALN